MKQTNSMIKPLGLVFVLAVHLALVNTAHSGFAVYYVQYGTTINPGQVTEVNAGGAWPPAVNPFVVDSTQGEIESITHGFLAYGVDGSLHATSSATLNAPPGSGPYLNSPVYTKNVITWQDSVRLLGGDGKSQLPNQLVLHFTIDGGLSANTPSLDPFVGSTAYVSATGGGYDGGNYTTFAKAGHDSGTTSDRVVLPLPGVAFQSAYYLSNGFTNITYSLTTFDETTLGSAETSVGDTMRLSAVTLPDGTTPESHGYTLQFDSGIPSPNLVPEPTSLILAATGTLALTAGTWRRRHAKASALSRARTIVPHLTHPRRAQSLPC